MEEMKFFRRSASVGVSPIDVYNRFLEMHEELQKSSNSLSSLINYSLKQLTPPKQEPRFSFSAEYQAQTEIHSYSSIIEEEEWETQEATNNLEKEQILENKIKIYDSALISLEEENQAKDLEIQRLKRLLAGENVMQDSQEKEPSQHRQELQNLDNHLVYLEERKGMQKKLSEYEKAIQEYKNTINSQQMEISRLKHINSYLHKSIEKLQKL